MNKKISLKTGTMNILNGISMGVVVALIPSALVGQLMKALMGVMPHIASQVIDITNFAASLLPAMAGFCVGYLFKMNMVQMSSIAAATTIGSGVVKKVGTTYVVAGTGDVINVAVTIVFAVIIASIIGNKLKNYTILLMPVLVLVIAGGLGLLTLPYVKLVTGFIGAMIKTFTILQPVLMGTLMGISFAVLIVSPISSVGIATAIGISGIASGSANLGITAGAFTLAIMGSSVNSLGTILAHFIGTPKIQMGNMLERPKLFIPVIISSGIMGALGAIFKIQGTPMSAEFGFAGLIGPMTAYEQMSPGVSSIVLIMMLFVILPIILGLIMRYIFVGENKLVVAKDLLIKTE